MSNEHEYDNRSYDYIATVADDVRMAESKVPFYFLSNCRPQIEQTSDGP